jgi:cytochrome c oxidase subunit 2
MDWLVRWITHPDQMLAEKDPIALGLLGESGQIPMPNLGVTEPEARALIDYIRAESGTPAPAAEAAPVPVVLPPPSLGPIQQVALVLFLALTAVIVVVFAWVALSTRRPQALDIKKAYGLRKAFFVIVAACLLLAIVVTISRTPYAAVSAGSDRIIYVAARQFEFFYSLEPIVSVADLTNVPAVKHLELPLGTAVEFRVTSLDVNHNFAIYGPQRRLLAQTQAMPGYVNRLRVHLETPGRYQVLCLEYCGAAHHLMQTELTVK